ncbi:MAG: carbohydrate kinase [Prolixibacteraceae bacterium]|jgi:fructokinase|nr:carbohydrate kinase [Prolixibacteraceae bacterium]MBT6765531.1 carbohydrate kinase [Prolixibacteraceae bacterium]MBT6999351.1 carbohydrate kinase [Prolixibacteraceae bacterium]
MKKGKISNILCFGEVLWDMLPSGAKPGGATLNVAIHLKKQGQNPILVSRIGNDKDGKSLKNYLIKSGLDTQFVQMDEKLNTSKVLVHLDEQKNATYEICEPVAWDNIQLNKEIEEVASNSGLIIYGSLASRNQTSRETLFSLLKSSKATRLLDVNLRPPYDKPEVVEKLLFMSDFIKLNDDELYAIASWKNKSGNETELIQWFAEYFKCSSVCVTRGANGAVLFINKKIYDHPGFIINAVDTVGAGDSFLASLVAGLSNNADPVKALEFACATGAFVASQKGAVPEYSEKEINGIINPSSYLNYS